MSTLTELVLSDIIIERKYQDQKWGEQNHLPTVWITIITEELGEAARQALESSLVRADLQKYRAELVQVAAVAFAAIEALDDGRLGLEE